MAAEREAGRLTLMVTLATLVCFIAFLASTPFSLCRRVDVGGEILVVYSVGGSISGEISVYSVGSRQQHQRRATANARHKPCMSAGNPSRASDPKPPGS